MLDVGYGLAGRPSVRVERVGIVPQSRDGHPTLRAEAQDFICARSSESRDVNVSDTCELALSFAAGPAGGLDAGELISRGKCEDLIKRKAGQDGSKEAELHVE